VALLGLVRSALDHPTVYLRIGREIDAPELQSLAIVGASYGTAGRALGAVGVLGPLRMDYPSAIASVRQAAAELSRFVTDVYEG
jgi:heat-inducible transcriptional repressor